MDRSHLFLESVNDLADRVNAKSEYELLMTTGLIRKLVLDGESLADIVNREHRFKLSYTTVVEGDYERTVLSDKPIFWAIADGISPRFSRPTAPTADLTLGEFLKRRVISVSGNDFTVKDAVKTAAYALGGIHPGTADDELHRELAKATGMIEVGGAPAVTRSLKGISAVIVDGLTPLADAVRTQNA